jgi:hypothetical protein
MYTYEAERRHTRPYTIITFSENGYISLMGLRVDDFTPFPTRDIKQSTIHNTAHQMRCRCIITAKNKALTASSFN